MGWLGSRGPRGKLTEAQYDAAVAGQPDSKAGAKAGLLAAGLVREGPPVIAALGDFITAAADASVNDTMSTTLTDPQWYRQTVGVNPVDTKIDGATEQNYDLAPADAGFRPVVIGRDANGVLTKATALQVVLPAPLLIDALDSIAGYTVIDPAKGVITLNQTAPLAQGTGGLQVESIGGATGFAGQAGAQKNNLVQVDTTALEFFGTVTALVSIPPRSDRQVSSVYANLSRDGGPGQGNQMVPFLPYGRMTVAAHVSENSSLAAQGAGSYGLVPTVRNNLPGNSRVRFDAVYGKAKQRPTIVLTFDDLNNDQPEMLDYLEQLGLVCTIMAVADLVDREFKWSTTQALMSRVAKGHQIGSNGTPDDASLLAQSSVANAVARWTACRDALIAKGFDPDGLKDSCYPNGDWRDTTAPVQIAAMTGNGTTTVTFGEALGGAAAVGWTIDGIGVPANTTIQSIAGDRLSAVLSNPVPSQTKPAYAIKKNGVFYGRALPEALQAAGAGLFRTTGGITQTFQSRFGLFDYRATTPGASWTSASLSQVQPVIDQLTVTGGVYMPYIHSDSAFTDWQACFDYIAAKKNAGDLDVLTMQQLRRRDGNASVPV